MSLVVAAHMLRCCCLLLLQEHVNVLPHQTGDPICIVLSWPAFDSVIPACWNALLSSVLVVLHVLTIPLTHCLGQHYIEAIMEGRCSWCCRRSILSESAFVLRQRGRHLASDAFFCMLFVATTLLPPCYHQGPDACSAQCRAHRPVPCGAVLIKAELPTHELV